LAHDATRRNDRHPDDQLGAAACIPGVLALRIDLERELQDAKEVAHAASYDTGRAQAQILARVRKVQQRA
jgi:hypothetical protein